jgi:hypothetical protein
MCFGKVGSCCSTSDRRRVNHVLVGPITNTSWVRAQLCKLEKRMHSYLLNRIALYVCGVSIVQLYKSDLLVDIYFGGYMKGKRKKYCFV